MTGPTEELLQLEADPSGEQRHDERVEADALLRGSSGEVGVKGRGHPDVELSAGLGHPPMVPNVVLSRCTHESARRCINTPGHGTEGVAPMQAQNTAAYVPDSTNGVFSRVRAERTRALTFARWGLYTRRRPATIRALGVVLLPLAITDAWYAADCPPRLDAKRAGVAYRERVAWRLSRFLRGTA